MRSMKAEKQVLNLWLTYKLSKAKKSDVYVMPYLTACGSFMSWQTSIH